MGETPPLGQTPTRVRFGVLGFICSLALITYLDRICIARVQGEIKGDLGIDDLQMGFVFNAFTLGYLLFEVPGGWMGDAWGSRRVITRIVLWWSGFTVLTGLIWPFVLADSGLSIGVVPLALNAFTTLLLVRFLFGCGEAGAFPNMARVVGSWFPYRERGLAQGTIWTSARLGGALAPLAVGLLSDWLGWRQAFWVLGGIGAVWCVFFYLWFRNTPAEMPQCNDAERALIQEGPYSWKGDTTAGHTFPPWRQLLGSVNLWAICLAAAGVSFSWYFYATWQIKFLQDEHGMRGLVLGLAAGAPFFFGAAGAFVGGKLSDRLVRRLGRRWGRSAIGLFGFTGAGLCVLAAGFSSNAWVTVALLCIGSFINDLAIPVIWAVSTDIGGKYSGTVSGFMNMLGGVGPLISQPLTPYMIGQGYTWSETITVLTAGWFVAALAWLRIDASTPLFPQPTAEPGPTGAALVADWQQANAPPPTSPEKDERIQE